MGHCVLSLGNVRGQYIYETNVLNKKKISHKGLSHPKGSKQKMVTIHQASKERRPLVTLPWQDEAVLESLDAGLKPVADFTDILSGDKDFM